MKNLTPQEFNYLQGLSYLKLLWYAEEENLDTEFTIMDIGYNPNSGYVYIAYEEGLSIAIFEGRDSINDIILFGYNDEGEFELDSIEEFKETMMS